MNTNRRLLVSTIIAVSSTALAFAQAPRAGKAAPRPVLSVTSTAWADGAEVPMHNAFRGDNKSPAFEFHWSLGNTPTDAPASLQTYAVIFHDVENSSNKTTVDTLHWTAFNIPGTARVAGRIRDRRPGRRHSERSGYQCNARQRAWLFRSRRGAGAAASLRVRVLRTGYQAGSACQHDPRRTAESDGWSRHRQGGVVRTFPRPANAIRNLGKSL